MSIDSKESPDVTFADLPVGSQLQIGLYDNTWIEKISDTGVRITPSQTGVLNPQTIVNNYRIPSEADTAMQQRDRRQRNRERDPIMQQPEWALRVVQADSKQKISNALQATPFIGPTKNPFDREHKMAEWEKVPSNSFFTVKETPSSNSPVYAKSSNGYVFKVCTYKEWQAGLSSIESRPSDEKEISSLNITPTTSVNVLSAPTTTEVNEGISDYVANQKKKGKSISPEQQEHLDHLSGLATGLEDAA
jgi:hypothetical protein